MGLMTLPLIAGMYDVKDGMVLRDTCSLESGIQFTFDLSLGIFLLSPSLAIELSECLYMTVLLVMVVMGAANAT